MRGAPAELAWGGTSGSWGLTLFSRGTPEVAWALPQTARGGAALLRGGEEGPRGRTAGARALAPESMRRFAGNEASLGLARQGVAQPPLHSSPALAV